MAAVNARVTAYEELFMSSETQLDAKTDIQLHSNFDLTSPLKVNVP
jgi:hypothetical protein